MPKHAPATAVAGNRSLASGVREVENRIFYEYGLFGSHRVGLRPGVIAVHANPLPLVVLNLHPTQIIAVQGKVIHHAPAVAVDVDEQPFLVGAGQVVDAEGVRMRFDRNMLGARGGIERLSLQGEVAQLPGGLRRGAPGVLNGAG